MKKYIKNIFLVLTLLSATAVVFSGCAGSSYSQGFDEAD